MTIADRAVLVTGANRGIGQALVEEALRRGAKRVYAGTRQPLAHSDGRVTPLTLDVTDAAQIQAAVERVESLDVLINNAGVDLYGDLSDRAAARTAPRRQPLRHLWRDPGIPAVADSFSGSDRQRAVGGGLCRLAVHSDLLDLQGGRLQPDAIAASPLAGRGVRVHAVLAGPVDTEMTRGLDIPKASPESVARAIFDGVDNGEEEIFPDPLSASMAESWRSGAAKALERQFAALLDAAPVSHEHQEDDDE